MDGLKYFVAINPTHGRATIEKKDSNNFIRFKYRRNKKTPWIVQSWRHRLLFLLFPIFFISIVCSNCLILETSSYKLKNLHICFKKILLWNSWILTSKIQKFFLDHFSQNRPEKLFKKNIDQLWESFSYWCQKRFCK